MNLELAQKIADAVLYEGYILYPYRPSTVKNRQRWTFGGLYAHSYNLAHGDTEPWTMQTECLVLGGPSAVLDVRVRFLHLQDRIIGELEQPLTEFPNGEPPFRHVASLRIGPKLYQSWQEATEREVVLANLNLGELLEQPWRQEFDFPAQRLVELLSDATGQIIGVVVRQQQAITGAVEATIEQAEPGLFKIGIRIFNLTPLEDAATKSRDEGVLWAFISTHTLLTIREGEFISLLDPPAQVSEIAAACQNVGTWPIMVGEASERDMMLSSPIILYDYPEIAPESAGDLFDGTEIDEILTLRILTLTENEKEEMRQVDERARALLERTEALSGEQLMQLHGTIRPARTLKGGLSDG